MDEDALIKRRNKAQRDGNIQALADIHKKLGDLYFATKRYEEALEAYKGQLNSCECLNDKLNSAIAHRMIGEVNADMGKFQSALKHQNLYLEVAKELKDLIEEQRAYATLGRTHLLIADTYIKESEKDKKMEVLKNAKKAFSKSIRVCDKLENKIDKNELMMMRARLLLNLGLVLEQQKDTEQALNLIKQAGSLCRKYNLQEDLHRTNIALAGLNERSGNFELALKNLDNATKVDDVILKADAKLLKAELLLKLGEWTEAKRILYNLYKSKRIIEPVRRQVEKLLRIVVFLCRTEDTLLIESNMKQKEKLYEKLGDAATAVRSLDKAVEYYQNMLHCAEETRSDQLGAALTSLAQTLRDAGKLNEAIPYAYRELKLCKDAKETCNSALYVALMMADAKKPEKETRIMFNKALNAAKESNDSGLERGVLRDYIEYLEKMEDLDLNKITSLNERLENLPSSQSQDPESEEETETPEIGADISLDHLSDVEDEVSINHPPRQPISNRRTRCVVKKNEKGETQLHVACIKGNVSAVEKLLQDHHPTAVRDHCGWTPLHEAANHGFVEIVRLLINAGADINDPGGCNCDGVTALHDAAANGHTEIVQLLLDSGANPNLLTKSGESALDCLEGWKERVDDLSANELKNYTLVKARLKNLTTIKSRKKKRKSEENHRWNALVDDDEEDRLDNRIRSVDEWAKPEKISAGEDYKRTIASMQHPGRQKHPKNPTSIPKITAPLIDSEEMLVDDNWLEDDIGVTNKRKDKPYFDGIPTVPAAVANAAAGAPAKRKSKNDSDREIEKGVDKSMKRQKVSSSALVNVKEPSHQPINLIDDEDSCDSIGSETILESTYCESNNWPKKKKNRQLNLFKQGFTKNTAPRSISPSNSVSPEPTFVPAALKTQRERHSWDSGVSETIDLEIIVDVESFDLKLHLRDLKKTMSDIEELIKHKFEAKTGCRPKMKFRTVESVLLAAEVSLEEIPRDRNKLKLYGEISQNELPSIVDRYKKVCETLNIDVTDSMIKSLRSCDNTSSFRLNSSEFLDEEFEPLVKCLRYQKNLQILNLSSAALFSFGDLLNYAISSSSGLCELHLQCCDIDYECLSLIRKLPEQLRVLDLSYNPLGSESQKNLHDLIKPLEYLQTLNLRFCQLNDFKFTITNSSLINLDISWNPIGGDGAANFLQRQLLNLNLSNTQNSVDNRANIIDKIFFSDSLKYTFETLESLELSSCNATDLDVEKILSQTPNLTRIILSNNVNITRTSLCAILRRKPTMSFVDLTSCRLIDNPPDTNLKLFNPQNCTLYVHMLPDVINDWEALWQSKGYSKKLPQNLVIFKPR